jgi:transcriptional regulator with XRE-family HTH domain
MAVERRGTHGGGTELGRFLQARRRRVSVQEAGLPEVRGLRRTPGLRREELATLAGISVDYYARLERGAETHPSPSVVGALARVLRLDDAEHRHLRELALGGELPLVAPVPDRSVPEGVYLLLESMRPHPVYVVGRAFDLLAANPGGLRLFAGLADWPALQRNLARYTVLHPAARVLFDDWGQAVRSVVGWLRGQLGVAPDAPDLALVVEELASKSPEFADVWERYDVAGNTNGRLLLHHPEVGELTLGFQGMTLNGTNGKFLVAFYAAPDTADHEAMVQLDRDCAAAPSSGVAGPGAHTGA